jgi:hypothetical protein
MTTMIDRSSCPARRHGTDRDYYARPGCRCPDAVKAYTAYRKDLAAGVRRVIPADGTRRRLHAMARDGHRIGDLGAELHVTAPAMQNMLRRAMVYTSTAELVTLLGEKKRRTAGDSRITRLRAERNLWLPWEAWEHADINDPLPVAEQEALVGWLNTTSDPTAPAGPLAILLARLNTLLPVQRAGMARKAHALYKTGSQHPLVLEGERICHRDWQRLQHLLANPLAGRRWTAA